MEEKLDFLIEYLIKERGEDFFEKPVTFEEKERVWRGLCNIRQPKQISNEYLKVQDEFLQERLKSIDITDCKNLNTIGEEYPDFKLSCKDKICLWKGDITTLNIDCIVNAANSKGLGCFQPMHNCIDNQVQTYSGVQMRLECNEYMKNANYDFGLPTGEAFITKGYNLPSKYVVHTVGPVISFNVSEDDKKLLENCYINSMKLASEKGLQEIAFPCISTGIFRFPRRLAVECAVTAVNEFLGENNQIKKVVFNVFGDENFEIYDDYFRKNRNIVKIEI